MATVGVHSVEFFLFVKLQNSYVANVTGTYIHKVFSSKWVKCQF